MLAVDLHLHPKALPDTDPAVMAVVVLVVVDQPHRELIKLTETTLQCPFTIMAGVLETTTEIHVEKNQLLHRFCTIELNSCQTECTLTLDHH
jgi:hypothetical protein